MWGKLSIAFGNFSPADFPETITDLPNKYLNLWNLPGKISLVYGGVTKVKQYVFEDGKLPDIAFIKNVRYRFRF